MLNRRLARVQRWQQGRGNWITPTLVLLFILYWLFIWYLERIDLSAALNQWWQALVPLPLPGFIIFFIEMLHPRVLRHMIPVFVGWWLARQATVGLLQGLYDLSDRDVAADLLSRLRTPGITTNPIGVSGKTLATEREKSVLLRVGGPGMVTINSGDAAVTEINGRFHRVLGPGWHILDRFEYIHAVLDLRQQNRLVNDIHLVTRDGIDLTASISITYRISTGGEPITRSHPYPFDREAVRIAAYAETILNDNKVSTWESIPPSTAKAKLFHIINRYRLDEILYPPHAHEPYLTIQNELERQVKSALEEVGIELNGIHLERLDLPEPISELYIRYWQAFWETQRRLSQADGEAQALEEREIARAEAEVTMIQAIVEGVQRARREGNTSAVREIVALRLIEALEQMARQSQQLHPLPAQLLPQLSDLRQQLGPGTNEQVASEGTTK